ncbi:hypothetical protein A6764_18880 [Brevibacillus sp. WF146]|jgi:hypothetical protein|uniref:hypothetical protein n=1 Tax=Brevibacillus sp. WF146 TaxID=319501 RepID=UPI0007ED73BF|nr:hypothetical protein [Brevibacillus sp. WF146]UYZ12845.1 hypothetical protein A6764_18880 [Brevibacillus sp. WF146]
MESKFCIPTKQEVDFLEKHFHSLDVLEFYSKGKYISLIDRFPRSLTEDEIEREPLSYSRDWEPSAKEKQKYLLDEKKFLRFFSSIYHFHKKNNVFVYCRDFADININDFRYLEDTNTQNMAVEGLSYLKESSQGVLKTSDLATLEVFVKLTLREAIYCNFFFIDSLSVLIGYYEMSFLLYCNDPETLKKYEDFAIESNLFSRKPNIG